MRFAWLGLLIAGCGFSTSAGGGPGPEPDPGGGSGSGSGAGSGSETAAQCDVNDASLRLCVSFGGTHMVQDLLTPPHVFADPVAGIGSILGYVTSTAGVFDIASRLRFSESTDFDVADLTFEMWMAPGARPAKDKRGWMFDNNQQYHASIEDDGRVRCGIGADVALSSVTIPIGDWHHIACTYDRADHVLKVHVDGDVVGCKDVNGGIPTTGTVGLAIGANYSTGPGGGPGKYTENFVGKLDGIHLYARARSTTELCNALGQTDCNDSCSGGGGGGGE